MKNMMSDKAKEYLRGWTIKFNDTQFVPLHKGANDHNLWFINCCTGAGKAACGFESIIEDIANYESEGKKSLNAVVVPGITLAHQVVDEMNEYFSANYPELRTRIKILVKHSGPRKEGYDEDGVWHNADEKIDIDNSKNKYYLFNNDSPHVIVVFVSDSFFGSTSTAVDINTNLNWFRNSVKIAGEMGIDALCGCIVFDEAHNYKRQFDIITGYDVEDENEYSVNKNTVNDCVRMTFMDTILMTGTPCQKQCYLSRSNDFKPYTKEINYARALGYIGEPHEPWIICPDVWVIRTYSDELDQLENAIVSAYLHEEVLNKMDEAKKNSFIHMLVNCKDINSAHDMGSHIYEVMKNQLHKEVDVIILHSDKKLGDEGSNDNVILGAELNGQKMDTEEAKTLVRKIDKKYVERDVIVFQVGMISEGINVNSFNAVILTSSAEVKVIQQTGRGVRFLKKKYGIKNRVSIYAIAPNKSIVETVICKQLIEEGCDLSKVLKGVADLTKEKPTTGAKESEGGKIITNGWTWADFQPAEIVAIEQKIKEMDWDDIVKSGTSNPSTDILDVIAMFKPFMVMRSGGASKGSRTKTSHGNTSNTPPTSKKGGKKKVALPTTTFKNQMIRDLKKKVENSDLTKKMCDAIICGDVKALPWLMANLFMCGKTLPIAEGSVKYLSSIVCKAITEND